MKIKRLAQYLTFIHRIHHIQWSYGYKLPFMDYGYFPNNGIQKLNKKYHNCTQSGVY